MEEPAHKADHTVIEARHFLNRNLPGFRDHGIKPFED